MPVARLGPLVSKRRASRGLRETAEEVGVSPATLSRVERGKLPDIDTFSKLCAWLDVDPAEILGVARSVKSGAEGTTSGFIAPSVHFRAPKAVSPQAATDLGTLILAAQDEMIRRGIK